MTQVKGGPQSRCSGFSVTYVNLITEPMKTQSTEKQQPPNVTMHYNTACLVFMIDFGRIVVYTSGEFTAPARRKVSVLVIRGQPMPIHPVRLPLLLLQVNLTSTSSYRAGDRVTPLDI